ncbi:FHA domain-containing protein [Kribbella sp. NPDC000426]|uniref:FHA domain-containing protein n=1 Tax=Kribbella sp. NPDC000426 TaxID=3154255 RepID=UPI003325E047
MTSVPVEGTRPSDAERDRALAVLRDGAGTGRLSHDTFIRRMNFVLRAQSRGELADAIRDLPPTEPRLRTWTRAFRAQLPRLKVQRPTTPNARTSAHPHNPTAYGGTAPTYRPSAHDASAYGPPVSDGPASAYGAAAHGGPASAYGAGADGRLVPGGRAGERPQYPAYGPAAHGGAAGTAQPARVAPRASRGARFDPVGVVASWLDRLPQVSLVRPTAAVPLPGLALPAPGSPTVRIGRAAGATLRMPDESVSRHHAELRYVDDGWMLRDLGSMNGTTVNGLRITTTVRVRPGDRVSFGAVAYVLTWTG